MARSEVVLSPLPFVRSGRKRNLSLLHSSSAWAVSLNCRQTILRFVSGSGCTVNASIRRELDRQHR
jgi:hypothetical protein